MEKMQLNTSDTNEVIVNDVEYNKNTTSGMTNFIREVASYFMDFLETDFRSTIINPKRQIINRNSNNLRVGINLRKYHEYSSLVWKVIQSGFKDKGLGQLKKDRYITHIPKLLLQLIEAQIASLDNSEITSMVKLFYSEIDIAFSKYSKNPISAVNHAIDGIERVIREKLVTTFVEKIRNSLDEIKTSTYDSIYQLEEEVTTILLLPFKDSVSSIINQLSLGKSIEPQILEQIFDLKDVQDKLNSFFKSFTIGDLYLEVYDLFNNKNLLEKQEFYLYFCDITYKNNKYPLFYIPIQIKAAEAGGGFTFTFESLLYVNKKAIQFILKERNAATEGIDKGILSAFVERIIYLSENKDHDRLIGVIDHAIKEVVNFFGLNPYIDIYKHEHQEAKSKEIRVTNNCYLALFDKGDEALINDYEEILLKLNQKDSQGSTLITDFESLLNDFITENPISVISEVESDWEKNSTSEKLSCLSPVPLNEEQRQILAALNKKQCKYITVEGPPGTGKSHTIVAMICNAILKNQSVLVLSDTKEALDVVEDKITEAINKIRFDKDFQNPILRLGKAGNTYSKILSTTSMQKIKEHYKVVKNEYKKLEDNIETGWLKLKNSIDGSIDAYHKITLPDIAEFTRLESEIAKITDLPVELEELYDDSIAHDSLEKLKSNMLGLRAKLITSTNRLDYLFKNCYLEDCSFTAFRHFINFLPIINELQLLSPNNRQYLAKIRKITTEGVEALERYIKQCHELRSPWLGYFLKGSKLASINQFLASSVQHDFSKPQEELITLQSIADIFRYVFDWEARQKIVTDFYFKADLAPIIHRLLTLEISLPSADESKEMLGYLDNIEHFLTQYPKTANIINIGSNDVLSLLDNCLVQYSDAKFKDLVRYLHLRHKLHYNFQNIPVQNYIEEKRVIEELVTTQMTYKIDERVVDFHESYRNDAKTLAQVISQKQHVDKSSFEKLKNSFPCILAGIRDFAQFIPLESKIFDLIIIDEASQVSIAQAFPALLRGKKIVVLGDNKQFSNVKSRMARLATNTEYLNRLQNMFRSTISDETMKEERLKKFNIKTSILEFFEHISNYSIMLKKHFRGYRELISYSNKYFYGDGLQSIKIRSKPIGQVIRFSVIEHDNCTEIIQNTNQMEKDAIIIEVERIVKEEPNMSIGIITPHTNQQQLLLEAFTKHRDSEHFKKQHKLKIMTFDTCQGEERDIILYSMVASHVSDKLYGIFYTDRDKIKLEKDNVKWQRLNVGLSRAKERVHFFLSKHINEFTGTIGEALKHYQKTIEDAKKMPDSSSTDSRSPMEKKVLHWLQDTNFFKLNKEAIELQAQFPLGEYLKQLDRSYSHPYFVVDFLLMYTDEAKKQHKIIIEYDGFEYHFQDSGAVDQSNYTQYYTKEDVYRQKVLESYGYNFLRLNRFNLGKEPIATIDDQLFNLVKKKTNLLIY